MNDMTDAHRAASAPGQPAAGAGDARRIAFEANKLSKRLHRQVGRAIVTST